LSDYVSVDLYLVTTKSNLLKIATEIHLSDSRVEAGILLGSSTLSYNKLLVDFNREKLIATDVHHGKPVEVPIYLHARHNAVRNFAVRAKKALEIPPGHTAPVAVDLSMLDERDYLLNGSDWFHQVDTLAATVNGVISRSTAFVPVTNFGESIFHVNANTVIGRISDLEVDDRVYSFDVPKSF